MHVSISPQDEDTHDTMIRCIDEPTSTETVARSVNEWQSKSKGSRDEAATIE